MTTLNFGGKSVLFFLILFGLSNCNKTEEIVLLAGEQSDFIVTASSGDKVVLDRTWYRDCIPVPTNSLLLKNRLVFQIQKIRSE